MAQELKGDTEANCVKGCLLGRKLTLPTGKSTIGNHPVFRVKGRVGRVYLVAKIVMYAGLERLFTELISRK